MRIAALAISLFIAVLGFVAPAYAVNPDAITQLLETRSCIGCNLRNADLHGKDLRGVNLSHANLRNADLTDANMMAVNFQDADLRDANFEGASVLAVNFMGANLNHAKFGHVNLTSSRICHTITPSGNTSDRDCS